MSSEKLKRLRGGVMCTACGASVVLSPLYAGLVSLVRHTCPRRRTKARKR